MKKILTVLVLTLCLGLVACGDKGSQSNQQGQPADQSSAGQQPSNSQSDSQQ